MLNLNLNFVNEDETKAFRGEMEESATSNSSFVNTEGCNSSNAGDGGDGDGDSCSVAGPGDNFTCFNFDILKVGDAGAQCSNSNEEDRMSQTRTQSELVTRQLFPVDRKGEVGLLNQEQINSFLLCPSNNPCTIELQQNRLVQVQQLVPIVQQNQVGKKSRRGPRSRSSQYRGVTFYRRTGRWESHIWDCGKQVYLGGFDTAHAAARAYDQAAIKFRGVDADINFHLSDYEEDMNQMKNLSKEEFVQVLRRQSTGVPRGSSKYRGVIVNKSGRWDARMEQLLGKKVYNMAATNCNRRETVDNSEASTYERETVSASHLGSHNNLDLNLGISPPSLEDSSTMNEHLEHFQLNYGVNDARRLQLGNPNSTTVNTAFLKGLPLMLEHSPSKAGAYPTFFPTYEENSTNNRTLGGSSQVPSNLGWQLHHQGQTAATLYSSAASSGFSSPAATALLNYGGHQAAVNHHFSSPATQYYYQLRPPPPP